MKILVVGERLPKTANREMPNENRVFKALLSLGYDAKFLNHSRFSLDGIHTFDLILLFGKSIYPEYYNHIKKLYQAKKSDAKLILWYFDACNPDHRFMYRHKPIMDALPYLDWLFTTDHSFPWENHITNYRWLLQGADPDNFNYPVAPAEPRPYDVIFTGAFTPKTVERTQQFERLQQFYKTLTCGLQPKTRVYGPEFFRVYQRAKVAYVPSPPPEMTYQYWSNRIYLATATGTPCVVGYSDGIEEHFEHGKEVLFFRNDDELKENIDTLISSAELRAEMGLAARNRTLAEHTYTKRTEYLLKEIMQ